MGTLKCEYCGRVADSDTGHTSWNMKWYCSRRCQQKAKGSSGGGVTGGLAAKGVGAMGNLMADSMKQNMQQAKQAQMEVAEEKKRANEAKTKIPLMTFDNDFDSICDKLQTLVTIVHTFDVVKMIRPVGERNYLKPVYEVAKPKIDEGLFRLDQLVDEATPEQQFRYQHLRPSCTELAVFVHNKYAWKNRRLIIFLSIVVLFITALMIGYGEGAVSITGMILTALIVVALPVIFLKLFPTKKKEKQQ